MNFRKDYVELYNKLPPLLLSTNNPEATFQQKNDETDCSFPISIVSRAGDRLDDQLQSINEFNTDMSFQPPKGYYVTLYGTNELIKRGYCLLQPVIIQPRNTNPIKVFLYKFSDKDDLALPLPVGLCGVLHCANYAHIKKQKLEGTDEISSPHIPSSHANFINKFEQVSKGKNFFE